MNSERPPRALRLGKRNKKGLQGENGKKGNKQTNKNPPESPGGKEPGIQ